MTRSRWLPVLTVVALLVGASAGSAVEARDLPTTATLRAAAARLPALAASAREALGTVPPATWLGPLAATLALTAGLAVVLRQRRRHEPAAASSPGDLVAALVRDGATPEEVARRTRLPVDAVRVIARNAGIHPAPTDLPGWGRNDRGAAAPW